MKLKDSVNYISLRIKIGGTTTIYLDGKHEKQIVLSVARRSVKTKDRPNRNQSMTDAGRMLFRKNPRNHLDELQNIGETR